MHETITMKVPETEELVPMLCYEDIEADQCGMAVVSLYSIWKTDNYSGQSGRGKNLFCHDADRSLYQRKIVSEYGRY